MEIEVNNVKITLTPEQLDQISRELNKKRPTIESIDNYYDACNILGKTPRTKELFGYYYEWYIEQLLTIIKAVNYIDNDYKVWKPDFKDKSVIKYIPWLEETGFGWSFSCVGVHNYYSIVPVGFYYKSNKSAGYICKKQIDLYNKWLNME